MRKQLPRTVLRILGACALWSIILSVAWVLLLRLVDPPITWAMCAQRIGQGHLERDQRPLRKISKTVPLAVIASEDQKFMEHHGFDLEAIDRAMDFNDRKKGRRVRGASTLSQQTAKNVFLWPGRTWLRKGLEVWFTFLIETFWSKERIMEVYLNVAETGKGRFGVEAAAQGCFGKPAKRLDRAEAALIAVVLPAPRRYDCRRPGPYVRQRQQWVMRNMNNLGKVFDPAGPDKDRK